MSLRWLLCALALLSATPVRVAPLRVVSLDYCADQYVLALADRAQITALSRGSLRDDSYFRNRARGIRQTRGSLEEVLALRPDLVVRNWGGPWNATEVYARFHVPVLQVGDVTDFAAARADVLHAARVFGHANRGDAIARDLDLRLARLRASAPVEREPVMYLSAGGAVAGSGTLTDAAINAAGGRNVRSERGWRVMPLEELVQAPPALVALGFFNAGRERMNAWSPSHHPALRRALAHARTVSLPPAVISCEAWTMIDAAEIIAASLRAP